MYSKLMLAVFLCVVALSSNCYAIGDCNQDGHVDISEVQSAVNMFLGRQPVASCVDEDVSGSVSIAEIQRTINTFLGLISANAVPVSNAGTAQSVFAGTVVTLNGSGSSDANGDPLTYSWSTVATPVGSTASLSSATAVSPTFTADAVGTYTFSLIVNDGKVNSAAATVSVTSLQTNAAITSTDGKVTGKVTGLTTGDKATVILGNDGYLNSALTLADGTFSFDNVPDGTYFLKIDINGYASGSARDVIVARGVAKRVGLTTDVPAAFVVTKMDSSTFSYHWEQDVSRSGYQQSAYINQKPQITFRNGTLEVIDLAAAEKLQHDYNIVLSNDSVQWNQELAYRLLETMKSIPQAVRNSYAAQALVPSKWVLTNDFLPNDIQITTQSDGVMVAISSAAFVYATPKLVLLDGLKGKFFSQKLHHALVQYVTDAGTNSAAVEKILNDRYGCTTVVPNYTALTAATTKEDSNRFQSFHPAELVSIINMFEEMPTGFHVVKGLKYLVRRLDGMPHPVYPQAAAVSWPTAQSDSYIEFMDTAFITDVTDMHRLVIHEKAHFMWANLFTSDIKNDWIAVGGWYLNPNDPDGWSTTKTTEFVTAYAHKHNPDEDMAESIAYYVLNPDLLKSRSLPKYEFIRDRIMNGDLYVAKIREDLTFTVLNLFPDYNYPGKIKRIDIKESGAGTEDKVITVEVELNVIDNVFDGAQYAFARVLSEIGTYYDFYMSPVNANGSILRGSFTISKYAKGGLWITDQIVVTDQVGNQRFEGENDFGWKLYVNNPLEDTVKPKYVANSLVLTLTPPETVDGHDIQKLVVTWQVNENNQMRDGSPVYAQVTNPDSGAYRLENYGTYNATTKTARVEFVITEYFAPGYYGVPYILMTDQAGNMGDQMFSASPKDEARKSVFVTPGNPDITPPELDLNRITVAATPTNPAAPDGETLVSIVYYARDDKSGLGLVNYRLLDPQGISHFQYHYHDNFYTTFFVGDPVAWKRYEISVVLPKGSPPGIWGLQAMEVYDKAHNRNSYNFVELLHFEIQ